MSEIGEDYRKWEDKGRGIAVFRCISDVPLQPLLSLPGSTNWTPNDPFPVLTSICKRLILSRLPERFFLDTDRLHELISRTVLPAYRNRVPLYLFTEAQDGFFNAGKLPFGDQQALTDSLRELAREQMGALVAQMCIVLPSPDAPVLAELPMTPIERKLAKAMDKLEISYEAQLPIGQYIVDFALRSEAGHVLCVEADGRDFHETERDRIRDKALIDELGVTQVLRFSGSKIWHNPSACAEQVRVLWRQMQALPPPTARQVRLSYASHKPDSKPELSVQQNKALTPLLGVVLTLAPAGSGKTRVLTRRVVEAVRAGVAPERILCVVFNKAACDVMESRINGEHKLSGVEIKTLHSLGFGIARHAPGTQYAGFKTADDETLRGGTSRLFEEAIREDNEEHGRQGVYVKKELIEAYEQYVSIFKKTLVRVGQAIDMEAVPDFNTEQAQRVAAKVDTKLRHLGLMTYDDQIYLGVETLLNTPKARMQYQQKYDLVLVDEFQDLTPVQFLLVRLLALPFNNLLDTPTNNILTGLDRVK